MAGATEIYRGWKPLTTTIPSGSPTASAVQIGGYSLFGLILPPITSGALTLMVGSSAEAVPIVMYDKLGATVSAATPGGTGGVALDSSFLSSVAGYSVVSVSGAPQTANRTLIWVMKG